jgi:serine/threonine protein phosphatase PrpC
VTVLRSGSATDTGRVRKNNQDLPLEAPNLFAVADGMGGHVGGEVAARVAIDSLSSSFTREPTTDGLKSAFSEANRAVWQESQDQSELQGMGTTLTAVALVGGADGRDVLALANVGDSRAYVFSDGALTQVTADHSLAEERMRQGEMTEEEAAVHPQRHILTRVLGVFPDVETDMWELQLRSGDRVVLCSDGLSNEVSLEEMGHVLATEPDPGRAARQLVQVANDNGGADNITVVVVDVLVGEDGSSAASVVKPIGQRAGPPLIVAPAAVATAAVLGESAEAAAAPPAAADQAAPLAPPASPTRPPATGEVPATSRTGALAPGAQLGFGGATTKLSTDGPESGENFLGNTQTKPIARSSVRAASPRPPAPIPRNESRRARRRRLGIPRRITIRVILFMILIAAVPVGAYFAIRWYAYDNWYPKVRGTAIVIEQGRAGGVLWFKPKQVDNTGITTAQLVPEAVAQIHSGVQETSLKAAKNYVVQQHQEYCFQHSGCGAPPPTGSNTIGPSGSIPTTPSTSRSTVPGFTPGTVSVSTTTTVPVP